MIPAPKQRWEYTDFREKWLAEIVSVSPGFSGVTIKILQANPGACRTVGQVCSSLGLNDILNGRNEPRWTYLEGQEAP